MSPADSSAYSHVPYIPYLLHVPVKEPQECQWQNRCRFPEKTSKWWISQLVCQPRPLSLITHASRDSVAQLEQMADLHWLESPPRLDHSLYVYYTFKSVPEVLSPLYEMGEATATESLSSATPRAQALGQVQRQRMPSPPPAHFQFPPLSPPASALPIPSCLRAVGEPTRKVAPQPARKNGDQYTYAHAPTPPTTHHHKNSNWPPVAPPASSLPTPSWYSPAIMNNTRVSSKDRAHRQDVKERRRARRSSPTQTPHPLSSKTTTPSASPVLRRNNIGYSPYTYGTSSDGSTKGRKLRRSCFTPKDSNRQMISLALPPD